MDWVMRGDQVTTRDAAKSVGQLMLDAGMFGPLENRHAAAILEDSPTYLLTPSRIIMLLSLFYRILALPRQLFILPFTRNCTALAFFHSPGP